LPPYREGQWQAFPTRLKPDIPKNAPNIAKMRQAPVWTTEHSTVSLTIYRAPEPKAEVQLSQRQQAFLDTAQAG
jgi:hypothetical protein